MSGAAANKRSTPDRRPAALYLRLVKLPALDVEDRAAGAAARAPTPSSSPADGGVDPGSSCELGASTLLTVDLVAAVGSSAVLAIGLLALLLRCSKIRRGGTRAHSSSRTCKEEQDPALEEFTF